MFDSNRKRSPSRSAANGEANAATCPTTGLTIPECSCRRCANEQIRRYAPWVLERRFGSDPHQRPPRA